MAHIRTLLLIDSDTSHANVFANAVFNALGGPFKAEWATTLAEGIERLRRNNIWATFVNLTLPDSQGLGTFNKLSSAVPGMPTLVIGGAEDEGVALEALQRGAKDYLLEDHLDKYSFVRAIRNMDERKTAEEVSFMEKERAQVILNSIGDAVLSTDINGKVTYLNIVAERMTGWTLDEALGKPLTDIFKIINGETRRPFPNPLKTAIEKNQTVGLAPNCILIRRDNSEFAIEDSAAPTHDQQGLVTGAVIVFHDVTKARAVALEMSHLTQHDILTKLPNRILLKDRLAHAIATSQRNNTRIAVLYLDLDGFKHINDSLGHAIGDRLLQSVSQRLLACVRDSDTLSRQGGDEFVVLLSEIAYPTDAGAKARKILDALITPHAIDQYNIRVTASIGMTTYPDDGEDAELLIKNADLAMYQAKENGRNNYQFFDKEMNAKAVERQLVEAHLRHALERNELFLHYQPQISLKTGEITGVEALIRWRHPERGLISPLQFISIAEDCGLILPIGRWVLREACRQARAWQDAGLPPIKMGVNVSAVEFRSTDFLGGIQTILADTVFDPQYLELELTESVLMQHVEFSVPLLNQLKAMGVRLAVDDFGTGYSSLSYLKQFPIDVLKVDQSFVYEIDGNTDEAPIVSAVINMSRSLKHRVIAEGVETAEQLAFLQAHGCDEGQGYLFSRPVSSPQFAQLLQTGIPFYPLQRTENSTRRRGVGLAL
jgi:diguanylate cyclase (GGDEF)-like protein/PAS domain S-box-containing protein